MSGNEQDVEERLRLLMQKHTRILEEKTELKVAIACTTREIEERQKQIEIYEAEERAESVAAAEYRNGYISALDQTCECYRAAIDRILANTARMEETPVTPPPHIKMMQMCIRLAAEKAELEECLEEAESWRVTSTQYEDAPAEEPCPPAS